MWKSATITAVIGVVEKLEEALLLMVFQTAGYD